MERTDAQTVAALLKHNKDTLLSDWESRVRSLPHTDGLDPPALRDHIPDLVDQLARQLEQPSPAELPAAAQHRHQRLQAGATIGQVVEEYKALRTCIGSLAERANLSLSGEPHRAVDEMLDDGIKAATEAYLEQKGDDDRRRREEYLTFVVHDLRSPLAAIYNAIHLLEAELHKAAPSERAHTILTAVKRNIQRMQALIVKLLQEERNLGTGLHLRIFRSSVELYGLAESSVRTLAPLAVGSATRIENRIPRGLAADVDSELTERVFQNLISNAIEHTPKGNVIVDACVRANGCECWVTDDGCGMTHEQQTQLFAHPPRSHKHGGRGLGLSVAKRIVEAHGGTLSVESAPGKGTTVRFSLPADTPDVTAAPA